MQAQHCRAGGPSHCTLADRVCRGQPHSKGTSSPSFFVRRYRRAVMVMRKQRVACVLVVCLVLALGDPGHLWPGSGSSSLLVQAKVPRAIVPQHSRLLGIGTSELGWMERNRSTGLGSLALPTLSPSASFMVAPPHSLNGLECSATCLRWRRGGAACSRRRSSGTTRWCTPP